MDVVGNENEEKVLSWTPQSPPSQSLEEGSAVSPSAKALVDRFFGGRSRPALNEDATSSSKEAGKFEYVVLLLQLCAEHHQRF